MYRLTAEGRKYLKEGLPEDRLVELLEKDGGRIGLDQARRLVEGFSIALAWAKQKGWVRVSKGEIELVKAGESREKEALDMVVQGVGIGPDVAKLLLKRNLVEEVREDIFAKAAKWKGKEVAEVPPEIIATGVWREVSFKPYNVSAKGAEVHPGKRQPYSVFMAEVKKKLIALGFDEMTGPMIETEFWNFDALFQPQSHPARDWADTYQLKYPSKGGLPPRKIADAVRDAHEKGWKYEWSEDKARQLMPRAHTTAVSARMLANGKTKVPGKYFCLARCFRPDVLDATHLIEFNQLEGIILGETLTFRNLLGLLKMFAEEFADATDVRFMPDYYPFTEPSVQMSAKHPKLGWVEFGGAGVFREELTRPLGIDVPVIAWGLGIDRLAMFKLGIKDIRQLFSTDLKWLREAAVV
jgi:phenylalanyl-tRNA synthetase alpha chain